MKRSNRGFELLVLAGALTGAVATGCGDKANAGGTSGTVSGTAGMTSSTAGVTSGTAGMTSGTAGMTSGTAGTLGGNVGIAGDVGGTAGMGAGTGSPLMTECKTQEVKEGACKVNSEGVYALKVEFDVWWRDEVNVPILVDPGRGKITVVFRGEISDVCDDGSDGIGKLHPCGSTVPPFLVGAVCTAVGIKFPDAIWDGAGIPDYYTKGSTTGFAPGDVLSIAQTSGLLGIDLPEVDGTFPKWQDTATFTCPKGKGGECFPDQDGDGKPGITITFQDSGMLTAGNGSPYACNAFTPDWTFRQAPLDVIAGALPNPDRAVKNAYAGMRLSAGGSGKISADCMSGTGDAVAGDTIPSRVYDCVKANDAPCAAADATFIDQNTPLYHVLKKGEAPPAEWKHPGADADAALDRSPSKGPLSSVVRLGDVGAVKSCGDVRNAPFPAIP